MKREPHSKFDYGIIEFELTIKWNDNKTENLTRNLPEYILRELETHFSDLDSLRSEEPENYNFD